MKRTGKIILGVALFSVFLAIGLLLRENHNAYVKRLHAVGTARGGVRLVVRCLVSYQKGHADVGFPVEISGIGPVSNGGDGCIDDGLMAASTGKLPKSGYYFTYTAGEPNSEGLIDTFSVVARPEVYDSLDVRLWSLFVDHTGFLRYTREDRAATKNDTPLR